jgi:hypothetical protein
LLLGTPKQDTGKIGPQTVAWAYERDDGGRGFVFGGVDFHDNMALEDYRRFLLNGIAWAAHIDVPREERVQGTATVEKQRFDWFVAIIVIYFIVGLGWVAETKSAPRFLVFVGGVFALAWMQNLWTSWKPRGRR